MKKRRKDCLRSLMVTKECITNCLNALKIAERKWKRRIARAKKDANDAVKDLAEIQKKRKLENE